MALAKRRSIAREPSRSRANPRDRSIAIDRLGRRSIDRSMAIDGYPSIAIDRRPDRSIAIAIDSIRIPLRELERSRRGARPTDMSDRPDWPTCPTDRPRCPTDRHPNVALARAPRRGVTRSRAMKIDEVPSLAKKSRVATHTHIKVRIERTIELFGRERGRGRERERGRRAVNARASRRNDD